MSTDLSIQSKPNTQPLSKEDALRLPFETFFELLENEKDWQRGKIIGDVLMFKIAETVQPVETEAKLPVARSVQDLLSPAFGASNLRQSAEDVFKKHAQNMQNIHGYNTMRISLQGALHRYHLANQMCTSQTRQEALSSIKEILAPFCESAKPAAPSGEKRKWYQFFKK